MRFLFFVWVVQGYAVFNLTWGTPAATLDSNLLVGDSDTNVSVAMDPFGNAIATWGRTTGKGASEDVWAAIYNHSFRSWAGSFRISGGGNACQSKVITDAIGNAIFVWEEGFPTQILSRSLSAAGVWTPPLNEPPAYIHQSTTAQTSPQIAMDSAGNAVAIWIESSKGTDHLRSAKKPLGLSWIDLGEISPGLSNAFLSSKSLALNETGNGIAVWQEGQSSEGEIYGARYTGGAWTAPLLISSIKGKLPVVGIDLNGRAIIVWNQGPLIQSKVLVGETLSAPATLSNPNYDSCHPDIGVDGAGNAVVVFERHDTMHKFIVGTSLPFNGSGWSAPLDISGPSPSTSMTAGFPSLSLNAIGDGVVIWKESTGNYQMIQGAGYSLGTWSFIKTLSSLTGTPGEAIPSHVIGVSINLAGNVVVAWPEAASGKPTSGEPTQEIKAAAGIGLATLGPLPPAVEPETVLNGIATGSQRIVRFPAHADLINTLTWTSPGNVAYYRIYRGNLSTLIGTTDKTRFEDHQRIPQQKETYLITSVDSNGQESCPMTFVINPI